MLPLDSISESLSSGRSIVDEAGNRSSAMQDTPLIRKALRVLKTDASPADQKHSRIERTAPHIPPDVFLCVVLVATVGREVFSADATSR